MAVTGWGKAYVVPEPGSWGVALSVALSLGSMNGDLTGSKKEDENGLKALGGALVPNIALTLAIVIGYIKDLDPSGVTGAGVRIGLGVSASISCGKIEGECPVSIGVGAVASAVIYSTKCPFGKVNIPSLADPYLGKVLLPFKCFKGAGVAIQLLCCSYDLVTGKQSCR